MKTIIRSGYMYAKQNINLPNDTYEFYNGKGQKIGYCNLSTDLVLTPDREISLNCEDLSRLDALLLLCQTELKNNIYEN